MAVLGNMRRKVRQHSPTPKNSGDKKSRTNNFLVLILAICISLLLVMVICLLGYLEGGEKDNVTDLPRLVRDNLIFGYNVSRDNILAIIPWTNNVVEPQTQIF